MKKDFLELCNLIIEEYEHSIELQVAIDQAINLRYFFEKWLSTSK